MIKIDKIEAVLRHRSDLETDPAHFVESDAYGQFYKALYNAGLINSFDWMARTDSAREYLDRPERIKSADMDTICRLLTTHVRNDRFCDGHLRKMILNGQIGLLLERLADLPAISSPAAGGELRVCIHRGAHQIGGTCVEMESQGKRVVLDVGMPLDVESPKQVALPRVPGLETTDPSLLGVVISHPHQDHYGLAFRAPQGTTFLMGAATERILAVVVPIHTQQPELFENTFGNVRVHEDGEWWEVTE